MNPMMQKLQKAGYDIEWHIVILGHSVLGNMVKQYKALAGAMGGSFLSIKQEFDESSHEAPNFLKAIKSSSGKVRGDDDDRPKQQREYELDASKGKVDKFDWYKALPPPNNKK